MNFTQTVKMNWRGKIYDAYVHVCFDKHIHPYFKSKEEFLEISSQISQIIKNNSPDTWQDHVIKFMDKSFVWNYYHIESTEAEPIPEDTCSFLVAVHSTLY